MNRMNNYKKLCEITNRELAPTMTRLAFRYVDEDTPLAFALLARAAVLWCPMAMSIIALMMKRRAGRLPKVHRGYRWAWWSWSVAILLHNSAMNKVAAALLKRVPQEMVKNINNWKFCSEHSWMVFSKMERMIEAFYQMTKDDPSAVRKSMSTCGKLHRSKYGIDFFDSSRASKEEMQVLTTLGIGVKTPRKRHEVVKKAIIGKPKAIDVNVDEIMRRLGGETIGRRVLDGLGVSLHYLNGKVYLCVEFDRTGIWFAKAYFRPYWCSSNGGAPSPINKLFMLVRFFRQQLAKGVDVIPVAVFKRGCDVLEMDEGCREGWISQGLFCVCDDPYRYDDTFPSLEEFLVSRGDNDISVATTSEHKSLSIELRNMLANIIEAVSRHDYHAESQDMTS